MMLENKVAIVTGGSQGIGKGIAEALMREGADVVINARNVERAQNTAKELMELTGKKAVVCCGDVSDKATVQLLVDTAIKEFGKLDIYINNASLDQVRPLLEVTEQEWDDIFGVNVKGYLFGMQLAAEAMKEKGGAIVNISSAAGKGGRPLLPLYAATKAVILNMTKCAAEFYGKYKIRINAINPGNVSTQMGVWALAAMKEYEGKYPSNVPSKTPLGRDGSVDDIANAVLYLTSDLSDYVTGQNINVDGGKVMN